jgi:O-antigen/teichoic acid export membrane protein
MKRLLQPLVLMALRMANTASKFLLTLYTARYLGLADLGIYGLLVGATTLVPAVLGLGTTDWVMRHLVTMPRDEAIASIATRLSLPVVLHAVGQPLAFVVNYVLGAPVPWPLLVICGLVLFLEHIASDSNDLLVGRGRILLANVLFFMRAGLWPPVVIVWGIFDPSARTLECLLLGWLGALVLVWLTLAAHLFSQQRWRALGLRLPWIASGVRASVPFYIKDLTGAASLYLDRFVLSLFLGLELTGVYTLFWSIANVLHNLTVFSVVQPKLPALIEAGQKADPIEFRDLERKLQIEAGSWIVLLAAGASVALFVLLPFLERPALYDHLAIFWILLLATALRAAADGYGFVLLALHRDTAIAVVSVAGAIASVALNVVLIPLLGIIGAALAYVFTSAGMLMARYRVTRSA